MMWWIRCRLNGSIGVFRAWCALAFLIVFLAPWSREAVSAAADKPAATAVKRDSARCLAHAGIDACNDAIRWNPSDPALLVALANAEFHANRPADALRHYRRAAELAPNLAGLNDKISAAEARLHPARPSIAARRAPKPASGAPSDNQYSNAAPLAESH
jgi:cytochrome c-type biogenesis protein CcmH/NrfG